MRQIILAVLVIALLGGLGFLLKGRSEPVETVENTRAIAAEAEPAIQMPKAKAPSLPPWVAPKLMVDTYQSEYGPLPASLAGKQIPFNLALDERHQLVVSEGLRESFDFFLALAGQEPIETLLLRIEELLRQHLPEPASSQALEVFQQYVALKKQEMALMQSMAEKQQSPEHWVSERRILRKRILAAPVYNAFYGIEDKRAEYSLKRHQILSNKALSQQALMSSLKLLNDQYPELAPAEPEHAEAPAQPQPTAVPSQQEQQLQQNLFRELEQAKRNQVSERAFQSQ